MNNGYWEYNVQCACFYLLVEWINAFLKWSTGNYARNWKISSHTSSSLHLNLGSTKREREKNKGIERRSFCLLRQNSNILRAKHVHLEYSSQMAINIQIRFCHSVLFFILFYWKTISRKWKSLMDFCSILHVLLCALPHCL